METTSHESTVEPATYESAIEPATYESAIEPAAGEPAIEPAANGAMRKAAAAAAKTTAATAKTATAAEMTSAALRECGGHKEKQHTNPKVFHWSLLLPGSLPPLRNARNRMEPLKTPDVTRSRVSHWSTSEQPYLRLNEAAGAADATRGIV